MSENIIVECGNAVMQITDVFDKEHNIHPDSIAHTRKSLEHDCKGVNTYFKSVLLYTRKILSLFP